MATKYKYSDIITYLDAIANDNNLNNDVGQAPHQYWWHVNHDITQPPLSYNDFTTGTVYNIGSVPIINTTTPLQSMFYLLLSTPNGAHGYKQMPDGGFTNPNDPNATVYLTDASCQITLADGSNIAGTQILAAMQDWLSNGYPQ